MKKLLITLVILFMCILLNGCIRVELIDTETTNENTKTMHQPIDNNILIYDDEYLTLSYKYVDDTGVYFSVFNKTDDYFSISTNYFIFDGVTFPQDYYARQVSPNYTDEYVYECDLENNDIETISGNMYIYGTDGFTIEEFEFKDISVD